MRSFTQYFGEHEEPVELTYGIFYPTDSGAVRLVMRDGAEMTSMDDDDLQEFYEKHSMGEFRVCTVCGKPFERGYMCEGSDFYACSDECFYQDMDERYGKGNWKETTKLTQDEIKAEDEFEEDSYYAFLDTDGLWHPDNTFYTEWD